MTRDEYKEAVIQFLNEEVYSNDQLKSKFAEYAHTEEFE